MNITDVQKVRPRGMRRLLPAVGVSVFLHAVGLVGLIAVGALLAPSAVVPPRLLEMILPAVGEEGAISGDRTLGEPIVGGVKVPMASRRLLRRTPGRMSRQGVSPAQGERHALPVEEPAIVEPPQAVAEAPSMIAPSPALLAFSERTSSGYSFGSGEVGATREESGTGNAAGATKSADEGGNSEGGHTTHASTASQAPVTFAVPRYNDNPKPAYPKQARRRSEQGMVLLLVRVSEVGRVSDVRVVRSSGSEALDEAALAAVKRWIFHPARRGGRQVEMAVHVPIHFRLEN